MGSFSKIKFWNKSDKQAESSRPEAPGEARTEIQTPAAPAPEPAAAKPAPEGEAVAEDVLFVDTAGRLHTKVHLMDELAKIRKIINVVHKGLLEKVFEGDLSTAGDTDLK